jgi:two-component system sensor histidine kinase AgrC
LRNPNAEGGKTMVEVVSENVYTSILLYPFLLTIALVVFSIGWNFFWSKIKLGWLELIVNAVAGAGFLAFCYPGYAYRSWIGSWIAIDFLQVSAAVITLWVIKYIKLHSADYLFLILSAYIINDYCYPKGFTASMLFIGSFTIFCTIAKRKYGKLNEVSVQITVSFFCAAFVFWLYDFIYEQGLSNLYYEYARKWSLSRVQKSILLLMLAAAFVIIITLIIGLMKKILQLYLDRLQTFSKKYKEIGSYLLAIPYFVGALLFIMDGIKYQYFFGTKVLYPWLPIIFILFLGTQIFYIRLLISTINLKEHLAYKETEQTNLLLFEKNMNSNIQEIREMKHDLKNIFLTMGEYIARSEDKELQEFYYEKIAPYAKNEIRMNDMYVKLQELQNESMKAFLYYKILQGMDTKIDMQFDTRLDHSVLPYIENISELTRIIGVFIDNALEECNQQLENGTIWIRIIEKEGEMSIAVKNTIREEVRKNGIYAGTTSKGLGRGNGLKIVKKLISKYDNILWNSYFQDDSYVQSITVVNDILHKR